MINSIRRYFRLLFYNKEFMLLGSISIFGFIVWRGGSAYPLSLDWDLFAHQHVINAIQQGKFSFDPTKLSDTFLLFTYTPLFALCIGALRFVFWFFPLTGYYFLLDTFHYIANIIILYSLGYTVTKNKHIALISGICGALIFESTVAQTAFFAIPQNTAALLVVSSFIFWELKRYKLATAISVITFFVHFIIGGVGLGLILILAIWRSSFVKKMFGKHTLRIVMFFAIGLVAFSFIISGYLSLNPFSSGESTTFLFSIPEKFQFFMRWYSLVFLFAVPGIISFLRTPTDEKTLTMFFGLGIVALIFLPIPYSFKFYTIGRFFIHVLMAAGVYSLISHRSITWILWHIGGFSALLLLVLFHNVAEFKSAFPYNGSFTTVSSYEIDAATFLQKQKFTNETLLVSDPATQHVIEALSGINSQGGAFATQETRQKVDELFPFSDNTSVDLLFTIHDDIEGKAPEQIILVISGRFLQWQQLPDTHKYDVSYNIWAPRDTTPLLTSFVNELKSQPNVEMIYSNSGVSILLVTKNYSDTKTN